MIKPLALFAAPVVALLVSTVAPASDDPRRGHVPLSWNVGGYGDCLADTAAVEGAPTPKVFRLQCPEAGGQFVLLSQTVNAAPYAGQRLRLSVSHTGNTGQAYVGLDLMAGVPMTDKPTINAVPDSNGLYWVQSEDRAPRRIQPGPTWGRSSIELDIPANAQQLRFGALLGGASRMPGKDSQVDLTQWQLELLGPTQPGKTTPTESSERKNVEKHRTLPAPQDMNPS